MEACEDDEDRTAGLAFGYTAASLSTNGVTGRPSEATAELGERLVARIADGVRDTIQLKLDELVTERGPAFG